MDKKELKKGILTAFFLIGSIVCFIAVVTDNVILAAIVFTVLFVTGIVSSSSSSNKNREYMEAKLKEFLDSFTRVSDEVFPRSTIEKTAPMIKETGYSRFNGFEFVFLGKTFLSEDISFGKERTDKDFAGEDNKIRFDVISRARVIKAVTDKTYPLIKFRCNTMEGGGSDEAYTYRLNDGVVDTCYTISSDEELTDSLLEMLSCMIPTLKRASDLEISFTLHDNSLYSYRHIKETGYFTTYIEMDTNSAETHLRELKEQLEVTGGLSDVL